MKVYIHLPNNLCYEIRPTDPKKEITQAGLDDIRKKFVDSGWIEVGVIDENGNEMALIIWGDVLKNSYITAH